MSGFIQGEDRSQATLFPERLDDYVAEDSAVRVIDVFPDAWRRTSRPLPTSAKTTAQPFAWCGAVAWWVITCRLRRLTSEKRGMTLHRYWFDQCRACALKAQCTTGRERRITRWKHEEVAQSVDGLDPLLDENP